jgi:hypothetical protein
MRLAPSLLLFASLKTWHSMHCFLVHISPEIGQLLNILGRYAFNASFSTVSKSSSALHRSFRISSVVFRAILLQPCALSERPFLYIQGGTCCESLSSLTTMVSLVLFGSMLQALERQFLAALLFLRKIFVRSLSFLC